MRARIGLLLPRSTDYPAMGYDIMDGLRLNLHKLGITPEFFSENIGYGEDTALNYNIAEKLILNQNIDVLVVYSSSANAEALYPLAETLQKPIIFLDAGMQLPGNAATPHCYHISLQGVHACRIAGQKAGQGNKRVLMATSFYDGGYRGPYGYDRGLSEAGGSVCGNFVSAYKIAEFTIAPYMNHLQQSGAESVAACFSSYLAELFFKALHEHNSAAVPLPFYCSPFMAEEQMLSNCQYPGGTFYAVVPWGRSVQNNIQENFLHTIAAEKNKQANIFHLLGWEAAHAVLQYLLAGVASLQHFSWESPRGTVAFHPATHYTYAPLYEGTIEGDENGKCRLRITGTIPVTAEEHVKVMTDLPQGVVSGWTNNYLCI